MDEDIREAAIWAQPSESEEEDGTAAFLARYTAAVSNTQPETISATYPTRQEWEEQLANVIPRLNRDGIWLSFIMEFGCLVVWLFGLVRIGR